MKRAKSFTLSGLVSKVVVCTSAEVKPARTIIRDCKSTEIVQKRCK